MDAILKYIEDNRGRYLAELKEFIAIPSISTSAGHNKDIRRCAEWIAAHLKNIGMKGVRIHPTKGHPIVYAEWLGAPGAPTVLLYGHYDVQPVDPVDLWTTPPFEATIRGENIYARGTADDKGQVLIHFKSVEAS
jgi:acetylornithine deacetylase/succinyl-diaminopimelate desuccinylase-like protein